MNNSSSSLSYQVSNKDLQEKIHHPIRILQYPELVNYDDIQKLLPNDFCILILLIETSQNAGQWVCLIRKNNIITFFDSYGLKYDTELRFVSNSVRQQLHESPFLTGLLNHAKKQGFKIEYNKIQLQQFSSNVSTCGKFVISICNAFVDGISLQEYLKLLLEKHRESNLSYDKLVNQMYQLF
jgi:hypothetical protein